MSGNKEIFKRIEGYEGYEISNAGRVISYKNKAPRVLKAGISNSGYKIVVLSKNSKTKTFLVHQLVAMHFLGYKRHDRSTVVHHIDEDKHNNALCNLEVITHRDNVARSRKPSSGYTGVQETKWGFNARIVLDGKLIYLGKFNTAEEAHERYLEEVNKRKSTTKNEW